MNILFNIINKIESHLKIIPVKLKNFSASELSFKSLPDKWSKKEILGHLCDSAINNLSRFVRAQFETEPIKLSGYEQNEWVIANHYQEMDIAEILDYWISLNQRIIFIISKIPDDRLSVVCELDNIAFRTPGADKTLFWLIEDYLVHMEHHLHQLGIND